MKILVIGDLHGQMPKIHFKNFDCIIQVGDVCDDSEFRFYVEKWFKELKQNNGLVKDWDSFIEESLGKRKLKDMENKSLRKGNNILRYLDTFEKPIFFVPGNWDQSYGKSKIKNMNKNDYNYMKSFYDFYLGNKLNFKLIKGLKNLKNCQFNLHCFNNINFIGYGLSSGPEKFPKRRKRLKNKVIGQTGISALKFKELKNSYKKIINQLEDVFRKRNKNFPTIFISHNVPYGFLDIVKSKENYAYNMHLGSDVAARLCLNHNPLLCVSGHVHEHFGKSKLGKTTIINAGFGKDANVLIDLDENKKKIRKIEFYNRNKKKN